MYPAYHVASRALAVAFVVTAIFCGEARAQQAPYDLDAQVTTSPSQVAPANPARKAIQFCNPNASISVAVCNAISRRSGAAIVCAFNGRGSITIPPSTCWGVAPGANSSATVPAAWNGIAASGTANITVIETE